MTDLKTLVPALAAALTLGAALPAQAQSWSLQTGRGATVEGNRDCVRGAGSANCEKNTTVTTSDGTTKSATRNRVTTQDGTTTSRQGFAGQTVNKTRTVTR